MKKLKEVVQNLDMKYFVLETDSPYLTPEPFRGKKNEPVNIKYVADKIAEIKKENELVLDQKLLAPKGPVVPDEYSLSRITSDKWSSEEIEKWWTVPGDEDVQEISDANDRLVNGIIGAAP